MNAFAVGDLNVIYAPLTTTATTVLPYIVAAAWICGGRAFGWKACTPQADTAKNLLDEVIQKFRRNTN